MANKVLLTFLGADVIFLLTGGLLIGFALISESAMRSTPTTGNVASHVLLNQCPLTATVVNAVLVFVTFLLSLPVFILPSNRKWLNVHGWLVVFCATFTLILGLVIWFDTLKTRANLASLWAQESPLVQSLLQQRVSIPRLFLTNPATNRKLSSNAAATSTTRARPLCKTQHAPHSL